MLEKLSEQALPPVLAIILNREQYNKLTEKYPPVKAENAPTQASFSSIPVRITSKGIKEPIFARSKAEIDKYRPFEKL